MSKAPKLPQNVIDYLNGSLVFNKFGLVNITVLKLNTGCIIENAKLKELIQEKFGKEMSNDLVEFIN